MYYKKFVKLGGLEVPFKKNSFGKKTIISDVIYSTGLGIYYRIKSKFKKENCLKLDYKSTASYNDS